MVAGDILKPLHLYEGSDAPLLYFYFDEMGPGFASVERRRELADRIKQATGAAISPEKSYPSLNLSLLSQPEAEERLREVLDWLVTELQ